eukprot:g37605.t1
MDCAGQSHCGMSSDIFKRFVASLDIDPAKAADEQTQKETLLDFVEKARSRSDSFNLQEFLNELPVQQHTTLWKAIEGASERVIRAHVPMLQENEADMETSALLQDAEPAARDFSLDYLSGVAHVALAFLREPKRALPAPMMATLANLHAILFTLSTLGSDKVAALQNAISQVCELVWVQQRPGREELLPFCLPYLLVKVLEEGATKADILRVAKMQEALHEFDMDDDSNDTVKACLLRCFLHPLVLRYNEGRKLCAVIFSLQPALQSKIHMIIKGQLVACRSAMLEQYGQIYLRAWQLCQGQEQLALEHCLQDLMHNALHVSSDATAQKLREVLSVLHKAKLPAKGVDEMLTRLYAPLLWRALEAANPIVRRNAIAVLGDAFPITNPAAPPEDTTRLLQKQFELLHNLLKDNDSIVRARAARAVGHVLHMYWELVPQDLSKTLLSVLGCELAFDKSDAAVRVSVFEALGEVSENHLAHCLLGALLKRMKPLLHDHAEKVQVAFLDLLLQVQQYKSLHVFELVSVSEILLLLERSRARVSKRAVQLLLPSYLPLNAPEAEQVARCLQLFRTQPASARLFFAHLTKHAPHQDVASLVVGFYRALLGALDKKGVRTHTDEEEEEADQKDRKRSKKKGSSRRGSSSQKQGSNRKKGKRDREEAEEEEEATDLTQTLSARILYTEVGLVEAVLVAMNQLWDALAAQPAASQIIETACQDGGLQRLLTGWPTSPVASVACLALAARVPSDCCPQMAKSVRTQLESLPEDASPQQYGPLLECLVAWGQGKSLLKCCVEGLSRAGLGCSEQRKEPAAKSGRKGKKAAGKGTKAGKGKRGAELVEDDDSEEEEDAAASLISLGPEQSLRYIDHLLKLPHTRAWLLQAGGSTLTQLQHQLHALCQHICSLLRSSPSQESQSTAFAWSPSLLLLGFSLLCRLELHTAANKLPWTKEKESRRESVGSSDQDGQQRLQALGDVVDVLHGHGATLLEQTRQALGDQGATAQSKRRKKTHANKSKGKGKAASKEAANEADEVVEQEDGQAGKAAPCRATDLRTLVQELTLLVAKFATELLTLGLHDLVGKTATRAVRQDKEETELGRRVQTACEEVGLLLVGRIWCVALTMRGECFLNPADTSNLSGRTFLSQLLPVFAKMNYQLANTFLPNLRSKTSAECIALSACMTSLAHLLPSHNMELAAVLAKGLAQLFRSVESSRATLRVLVGVVWGCLVAQPLLQDGEEEVSCVENLTAHAHMFLSGLNGCVSAMRVLPSAVESAIADQAHPARGHQLLTDTLTNTDAVQERSLEALQALELLGLPGLLSKNPVALSQHRALLTACADALLSGVSLGPAVDQENLDASLVLPHSLEASTDPASKSSNKRAAATEDSAFSERVRAFQQELQAAAQ